MHAYTVLGISSNLARFGGASDKETWVQSPGWEDPLQKEMATHSSLLAWKYPWTEEPDRLRFRGLQKSWTQLNNWAHTHMGKCA